MAITCQLVDTARPVVQLDSPKLSAVRQLGAARDVGLVTELLGRRVPGLDVRSGYYDDARAAWWEQGTVHVNLNRADVSSPLHELSEVWGAVYEQQQPEAYARTLEMLRGTSAHEQVRRAYPELDERGQLREALHLEVQQAAAPLLGRQLAAQRQGQSADTRSALSGAVDRLWAFVEKFFYRMGAQLTPERLARLQDNGQLSVSELTQALARELVLGGGRGSDVLRGLNQHDLERLGSYARAQQITNAELRHEKLGVDSVGGLLEFLSGQETNAAGNNLTRQSQQIAEAFSKKPHFQYMVYNDEGRVTESGSWKWESDDRFARIEQVRRVLRDNQAAPDGAAMRLSTELFGGFAAAGSGPTDKSDAGDHERARLAYGAHGIFPEFVPGDKVVHYSAATMGQDYEAVYDTGNLIVHLGADGKPRGVAAITRQRLGEQARTPKLLGGLAYYQARAGDASAGTGFLGTAARKSRAGKSEGVDLSASPEQLQKLQALAAAMHLTQRGHTISRISVANLASLSAGEGSRNAVSRVLPTAELMALRSIARQPAVRQLLAASGAGGAHLLQLLDDEKLYAPERYASDYVGSLVTNFISSQAGVQERIQRWASEHEQQNNNASLNRLMQGVRARIVDLTAGHNPDATNADQSWQQNPELVQLTRAYVQLSEVSEALNPHQALGNLDKLSLDYNNNASPAMVFLVNRYKSMKLRINQAFAPRSLPRRKLIEALRAEKGTLANGRLLDREHELYANLMERRDAWQYDKAGKPSAVSVPTGHFKLPGTASFEALSPAEKAFISYELNQIKEQMSNWHRASHRDPETGELGSAEAAKKYYEAEWSRGQIPLTPASVSTRQLQGDYWGNLQGTVHELLGQNPYFDDPGGQRLSLSEYYQDQGGGTGAGAGVRGNEPWGGSGRMRLLGVRSTDEVHPDTGEALGFLVDEDWEKTQARFDQNLGRSQLAWAVEMLRHEFSHDAATDYKMATVLLRDQEQGSAFLRNFVAGEKMPLLSDATPEERAAAEANDARYQSGQYAWMKSEQNDNLRKAFRQLFLGDTQQGGGSAGLQAVYRAAAVMASVFRTAVYTGNIMRPIKQTISGFIGQLAPILAAQTEESKKVMDGRHLKDAVTIVFNPKNWDMLLQLGVQLDVVASNARQLAKEKMFLGDITQASEVLSVDKIVDRLGDEMLSLTTMVIHLKTSGAWDAYQWNEEKGVVEYSEAADRKARGDATIDAIKRNLVANGVLEPGEDLRGAYDLPLLRSLESSVSDVKGGYSPASSSELGSSVLGNQLLGQRRWFLRRVLNAIGVKRASVARQYYDADGRRTSLIEEGQFESLQTGFYRLWDVGFNPMKAGDAWKGLESHEKENIRRVVSNLLVTGGAMLAVAAIAGLSDDEEDKLNKKRSRQNGVLDTIIQEASIVDNMSFALDAAANPFIMMSFYKQGLTGVGNVLTGDFEGAARVAKSKTGLGKMLSFGQDAFGGK